MIPWDAGAGQPRISFCLCPTHPHTNSFLRFPSMLFFVFLLCFLNDYSLTSSHQKTMTPNIIWHPVWTNTTKMAALAMTHMGIHLSHEICLLLMEDIAGKIFSPIVAWSFPHRSAPWISVELRPECCKSSHKNEHQAPPGLFGSLKHISVSCFKIQSCTWKGEKIYLSIWPKPRGRMGLGQHWHHGLLEALYKL